MNPTKAPSPDGIHLYVLKMCAINLSISLFLLFEQYLTTDTLPRDQKSTNVTPIYKKGLKRYQNNYQLIITCQVVKVLESLIRGDTPKFLLYTIKSFE